MIVGYSVIFRNDNNINDNEIYKWNNTKIYTWNEALDKASEKVSDINKKNGDELRIISLIKSKSEEICKQTGETIVYKLYQKGYNEFGFIYIIAVKDDIIKGIENLKLVS